MLRENVTFKVFGFGVTNAKEFGLTNRDG